MGAPEAVDVSEIYTVTKQRRRRRGGQSQPEQPDTVPRDELVESCSWWYVAACFVASSSYTVLYTIFAITLADWTLQATSLLLPIAATCMILGVFLRPTDQGAGIKILHLQFFSFGIGSEVFFAVGLFKDGFPFSALTALARIPLWLIAYWLGLKLRRKAAQLPPAQLSKYLCHTVLVGGVSAMAPMIFFMFAPAEITAGTSSETRGFLLETSLASLTPIVVSSSLIFYGGVERGCDALLRVERGEQ